MSRRPIPIKVKPKDLSQIGELLRGGIQQVRVVLRALSLRQLADGFTAPEVAQALPLTAKAVRQIAHRYTSDGLAAAVYAKQRPGAQEVLDGPAAAPRHPNRLIGNEAWASCAQEPAQPSPNRVQESFVAETSTLRA